MSLISRAAIAIASFGAYAMLFLALGGESLRGAGATVTVPVVVAAWLFGLRGGVIAGLTAWPVNTLLFNLTGVPGWNAVFTQGGAIGSAMLPLVGAAVGRFRDMRQQVVDSERQLRKAHGDLQEATANLVHTERMAALGELATGVAHELNQPLNGIKLISQIMLRYDEALDRERLHAELRDILGLVDAAVDIVEHMQVFSRRRESVSVGPVDVNHIIEGALRLQGQQLADHGILLRKNLCSTLPAVPCDPVRLEQVLMILLANARDSLDACAKPEKTIEITTDTLRTHDLAKTGTVVVEVKDNGDGIPDEASGRIFEPFFTTKEQGQGTGLGLSIAAKVIKEHGGTIEVESREGQQTVFRLVLPSGRPAPLPKGSNMTSR